MSQVRVHNFSVSLDGFGTGEGQSLDAPFGHAGTRLHEWFFPTRTFRAMQGQPGGSTGYLVRTAIVRKAMFDGPERKRLYKEAKAFMTLRAAQKRSSPRRRAIARESPGAGARRW